MLQQITEKLGTKEPAKRRELAREEPWTLTCVKQSGATSESIVKELFAMAQETRVECFQLGAKTIDWVETLGQGLIRVARTLNKRTEKLAELSIGTGETIVLAGVETLSARAVEVVTPKRVPVELPPNGAITEPRKGDATA
jgi:hypothetical protein